MRKKVRLGIIGMGNAGMMHTKSIVSGIIHGAELKAVCDSSERLKGLDGVIPPDTDRFESYDAMLESQVCDAIIIATPHPSHPELAVKAFESGHHVFCEKPAGADCLSVRKMNEAAEVSGKLFTMNFNRRLEPVYLKLKNLIDSGESGRIRRIQWTSTDWFRTDAYYASAPWRGTWSGESGGVLLNQCVHILDLWQSIFKMPERLTGFCKFGKYHDIEVEDEATAVMEYKGGITGSFIASSGESPGTNRIELACDNGRIVVQDKKIIFNKTRIPLSKFNRTCENAFSEPEIWNSEIPISGQTDVSSNILRNFIEAIQGKTHLIVDGKEGLKSQMLANAILLSSWTGETVRLPFDEVRYKEILDAKSRTVKINKPQSSGKVFDLSDSFK